MVFINIGGICMLIVVDRFDSKKEQNTTGKKFYYIGILDTDKKVITYQHREILVNRVLRGGLDIKGATIRPDGSVQFRIQDTFYTKHNSMKLLEITYPYEVDLHLLSRGYFRFIFKSALFYHTIIRCVKYIRPNTEFENYPTILPNTNNENGKKYIYKHYSLTTSTTKEFNISSYINEVVMLCKTYNIISLSRFPRYRNTILDLSEMCIDNVIDYTRYLSEVVCERLIMCSMNLNKLVSLKYLLVNHKNLRVVDFSTSFNDLDIIYDENLFILSTELSFENIVFVLPNAPKFIDVIRKKNNLIFGGYCDINTKEQVIQNTLNKCYLLGKQQGLFLIQTD